MKHIEIRGRAWDGFDGYLFDIDETLLHCTDAVHYFGFCEVLTRVAGRPTTLDGVVAHGNVDVGIMRDALALAGVPESQWRPRLPEMREELCAYVATHRDELRAEALPGVREILTHLQGKAAVLGIATGNLAAIGKAKLQHVGIGEFFTVGGWSDEHETRADVFRAAITKMRAAAGDNAAVCVVGDTPADVAAARANELPVIAVATGIYTREELAAAGPDAVLDSFEGLV